MQAQITWSDGMEQSEEMDAANVVDALEDLLGKLRLDEAESEASVIALSISS